MKNTVCEGIAEEVEKILLKFNLKINSGVKSDIYAQAYRDLKSFAERDPSSIHNMLYILQTYKSYYAVLIYRVANVLYLSSDKVSARKLSEYAKLKSGIEIHPGARIGESFVLDHGNGTVIGETTIIGKRCYILQDVVLGSTNIASNVDGQRHPIIGNDVEIGGFVRIYGNVKIGDSVKISPGAVIKSDIPSGSKVIVSSNYQITQGNDSIYFTGYNSSKNKLALFFNGKSLLEFKKVSVFVEEKELYVTKIEDGSITISTPKLKLENVEIISMSNLRINIRVKEHKKCVNQ